MRSRRLLKTPWMPPRFDKLTASGIQTPLALSLSKGAE